MSMIFAMVMGVAAAAPTTTDFTVGGKKFRLTLPAGFCLPGPEMAGKMAQIAASDPANITDVALIECDVKPDALPELVAIKTLRVFETTPLNRETFIAEMVAALPLVEAPAAQRKLFDQSADNVAAATGSKVDLTGKVRGQGQDAVCAYLGGSIDVAVQNRKVTGLVGACATVVGTRQFSVYRVTYRPRSDGGAGLLPETRSIALAITPLPDD